MRELGRLYEMTMKFRTISRTRHAGRRARSRQIIKQHGASRSEGECEGMAESAEKQRGEVERGTGGLEGDAGKFPPTSRRFRPAAFSRSCPVNRKAGYSFRDEERAVGGRFVDVSSSLYGTRGLHPRQVDRSRARTLSCPPPIYNKRDFKLYHLKL